MSSLNQWSFLIAVDIKKLISLNLAKIVSLYYLCVIFKFLQLYQKYFSYIGVLESGSK